MKQYLEKLQKVLNKGTHKEPARKGMVGTTSLFGEVMKFNLSDGFPIVTTKAVNFNKIATELIWFLRGDTNVSFLNENGFTEWNEDSYAYYLNKSIKENLIPYTWEQYDDIWAYIRSQKAKGNKDICYENLKAKDWDNFNLNIPRRVMPSNYRFGDCGYQYGKVWRDWDGVDQTTNKYSPGYYMKRNVDQIKNVFESLRDNPLGRRHLVTAVDPVHDTDLALYWCHSMFQFNCRPLTFQERLDLYIEKDAQSTSMNFALIKDSMDEDNVPKYFLDCSMYQRSADMFLGVPFNISSYALLTHIFAKLLNMVPGTYTHMFGDMHIYDNHKEQVKLQLTREPYTLPTLYFSDKFNERIKHEPMDFDFIIKKLKPSDFKLDYYQSHPYIKGELSTGIPKEPKRKDYETEVEFNIAYNTYHGIGAGSGS